MKKYMIRCDIEGVSGVVSPEQAEPGKAEFAFGSRMFMNDLLAMVNGLFDGGADEVHIYDEHFYGRNIDLSQLPQNVILYCGKPPYRADWGGGLDTSFDGLLLLGLHSMALSGELLCHTYEPDIREIYIDDAIVGEIGMEAAIAGYFDVPLVMVTADSAGVEEAKRLVPGVRGVSVKQSLGEQCAICYPAVQTKQWIREMASAVVSDPPSVKPFVTGPNVQLRVRLNPGDFADRMCGIYPRYAAENEVIIQRDNILEAYSQYCHMKLSCL